MSTCQAFFVMLGICSCGVRKVMELHMGSTPVGLSIIPLQSHARDKLNTDTLSYFFVCSDPHIRYLYFEGHTHEYKN